MSTKSNRDDGGTKGGNVLDIAMVRESVAKLSDNAGPTPTVIESRTYTVGEYPDPETSRRAERAPSMFSTRVEAVTAREEPAQATGGAERVAGAGAFLGAVFAMSKAEAGVRLVLWGVGSAACAVGATHVERGGGAWLVLTVVAAAMAWSAFENLSRILKRAPRS